MDTSINYILWITIIILTSYGFDFLKTKNKSNLQVFLLVFLSVWIIAGLMNSLFQKSFNSVDEIFLTIVETLPMTILFGGTTLIYKYYKNRRKYN